MYEIVGKKYGHYELKGKQKLTSLNGTGYVLEHTITKAKVVVVANDDENKVFTVGFRTPPKDDTGVPHITEHSVLCGSRKFPLKDPFVELVKGSMNTFLNAMTYSDKTVYPIASCNDKDFHNLMDVYLDAVFYPNIYKHPEILKQEGWHYELNDIAEPITYKGVVYNEMKGVFSSPEQQLMRAIQKSLLGDTTYGYESGGEPEAIPDLSYEDFLAFHVKYYHPSNSYIYLYGNMDMEKELCFIHEEYLSQFEYKKVDSFIEEQQPFQKMKEVIDFYPISKEEEEKGKTYLSYNVVIKDSLDKKLYVAFQVLEYLLFNIPGAPVKKAVIEAGIGNDVFSSYDNGIKQPTFAMISQGANEEDKDRFLEIIKGTLKNIVENGLDKKSLKAAINILEFQEREGDFGRYPKGLMYGLKMFDSWLYDDEKPFIHIETESTFAFLKEQINTNYYEELIQTYFLENSHSSFVILKPKKNMAEMIEKNCKDKLASYKESLSKEELLQLVEETKALEAYQSQEETQEAMLSLPMLTLEDIKKESRNIINKESEIAGVPVISREYFTNKISYIELSFNLRKLPLSLVPYAGLLSCILKQMDTKEHSYNELANEINLYTGGIAVYTDVTSNADVTDVIARFGIGTKTLYGMEEKGLAFVLEIIYETVVENEQRLKELLAELYAGMKLELVSKGNITASSRARSYFDKATAYRERLEGLDFYLALKDWQESFEDKKTEIIANLKEVIKKLFTKENLIVNYTGENLKSEIFESAFMQLKEEKESTSCIEEIPLNCQNEAIKTSSQVQYVALAGPLAVDDYRGSLKVLQKIFSYEYLWQNVRVKGGAYGCSGVFVKGYGVFSSYRDPGLSSTYEIYNGAAQYVKEFNVSERDMLKYIIGTISDIDVPLTARSYGSMCFGAYLAGLTKEEGQKRRDEILATTVEDIRNLAPVIEKVIEANYRCCVGNETKIEQEKELFDKIITLS